MFLVMGCWGVLGGAMVGYKGYDSSLGREKGEDLSLCGGIL